MSHESELARSIIDAGSYMTLATADADGVPWASPVWYAKAAYDELLWVSKPEARHSRNIDVRREIAISIFDSTQPEGTGEGVYMAATAEQLSGADLRTGIEAFNAWSEATGGAPWTIEDVQTPARHRLYRARVARHWVLGPKDERIPVALL
jgi:predicted pyridoxine 5'-phosphate oxidase superfamily flavin-nucleotide-binding protein